MTWLVKSRKIQMTLFSKTVTRSIFINLFVQFFSKRRRLNKRYKAEIKRRLQLKRLLVQGNIIYPSYLILKSRKKSYSRSPSVKKSARKEALSVEDLNLSRDSARTTPRSTKRKLSGSQGHSKPSPLRDSKMSIPLKGSVGHDNPPKPQRSTRSQSKSKRDKPSPKRKDLLTKNTPLNIRTYTTEDPVTSYNFVGILGVPNTAPNEAGKKLLGSMSSNSNKRDK